MMEILEQNYYVAGKLHTEVRGLRWCRSCCCKRSSRLVCRRRWTLLLLFALLTLMFVLAKNLAEDVTHCSKSTCASTSFKVMCVHPASTNELSVAFCHCTYESYATMYACVKLLTCQLSSSKGSNSRQRCVQRDAPTPTTAQSEIAEYARQRLNAQLAARPLPPDHTIVNPSRMPTASTSDANPSLAVRVDERDYAMQRSEARPSTKYVHRANDWTAAIMHYTPVRWVSVRQQQGRINNVGALFRKWCGAQGITTNKTSYIQHLSNINLCLLSFVQPTFVRAYLLTQCLQLTYCNKTDNWRL